VCCCNQQLAAAVNELTRELKRFRVLQFPLPAPPWPIFNRKTTKVFDEESIGMTTFMKYRTALRNLPPAEGRNKDIAYGNFIVVTDGVAAEPIRVDYDLATRAPIADVEWKAKKGGVVLLQLQYIDDDGNASPLTEQNFGVALDTIAPDAPSEVGDTTVVDEVDE